MHTSYLFLAIEVEGGTSTSLVGTIKESREMLIGFKPSSQSGVWAWAARAIDNDGGG